MVDCAIEKNAELVIASRDADYGAVYADAAYINDHLHQEFRERVSKKRKIVLCTKISEALNHFKIAVTEEEKKEEKETLAAPPPVASATDSLVRLLVTQPSSAA